MSDFVHEQAGSRVVFGAGGLARVGDEAERLGAQRVLLVHDRRSGGLAAEVAAALGPRLARVFGRTAPHVPAALAAEAAEAARDSAADLVVSIGGGSATGLAKAVALGGGPPILAVPTTYAGSEMTPVWGVTTDGHKRTGRDTAVQPVCVVYDPVLTLGLPAGLSAASGMNAVAHLVEAAYGPALSPLTALAAAEGVRVLADALPRVVRRPDDLAARTDALRGAWLAGLVLGTGTMGVHHRLCHVLGGLHDLPHAATHAAVLPYAVAYNRQAAAEGLAPIATALGGGDAAAALWDLARSLGLPAGLPGEPLDEAGISRAAALTAEETTANPRPVDSGGARGILRAAIAGQRPQPTP